MTTRRPLTVIGGGLAALTLVLGLGQVLSPAAATPADNGDVKTHNLTTPYTDQRDEPKVCGFYLAAFNFDAGQTISYWFVEGTPFDGPDLLPGSLTVDGAGNGHTGPLTLDEGMYKLYFKPAGAHGNDKFKVFKVVCTPEPTPTPTSTPTATPTATPTVTPTTEPTVTPTTEPTVTPTTEPTVTPTAEPTVTPTASATPTPPFTGGGGTITGPVGPPTGGGGGGGTLPFTGRDVTALAGWAGLITAAGVLLLLLGRRRTERSG